MNHQQGHPYGAMTMGQHPPHGYPSQQQQHGMPPSASMPLTAAALSASTPVPGGVPYYPQQHHPMMHQQHMMMHPQQQQQQQHQQQQQQQQQHQHQHQHQLSHLHHQAPPLGSNVGPPLPAVPLQNKSQTSNLDPNAGITTGLQCDFCGGDEQENKTTKLPEQMITCKVSHR